MAKGKPRGEIDTTTIVDNGPQSKSLTRPKVVTEGTIDKYAVTHKGLVPHLKGCYFSGSAAAIFDWWLEGEKLRITIEQVHQDMFGGK